MDRRRLLVGLVAAGLGARSGIGRAQEVGAPRPRPTGEVQVATALDRPLKVAIEGAYPPFSQVDGSGRLSGFDVEIAQALCQEMGARCELVQRNWAVIQDAVMGRPNIFGREFDLIVASLSITPSRLQTVEFSDKYYHVPARFLVRRGTEIRFDEAGLRGRRLGVQEATTHHNFILARFGRTAEVSTFATLPDAVRALGDGRVDAVLADALALDKGVLKMPGGEAFAFAGPAFTDTIYFGSGAGIAMAKGNGALRQEVNAALRRLKGTGRFQEIASRYFTFDLNQP
jgi:arginine/ornithine transport system substrate-binding protein